MLTEFTRSKSNDSIQILIAWLESNQRPVLIHAFTVSFTIIVSTDLPLNYTQSKMVGYVGNAPTLPEGNAFTVRPMSLMV